MYYYLVNKIGDGTKSNPIRPYFDGAFVWNPDAICPHCSTYIIGLPKPTDVLVPVTDLETACFARGLPIADVVTWFVGDGL
ncbi:hypothetical protein [Neobacillus drentensis]|uniref:hypothetical protein n=1 Tax=Neobacillus drentensis TaxID=220684 RepID=UPI002860A991|nr:hypothetical protein [Neobacillus drentensis]MDR7237108.1 hypothetical protein [Neobacillus drentensis]